jgi:hypothetical protein
MCISLSCRRQLQAVSWAIVRWREQISHLTALPLDQSTDDLSHLLPYKEAVNKLVIYTFPTQQECSASIPAIKRKHKLFFKTVNCLKMANAPKTAQVSLDR